MHHGDDGSYNQRYNSPSGGVITRQLTPTMIGETCPTFDVLIIRSAGKILKVDFGGCTCIDNLSVTDA
jgi:uncharacterized ParB-like nuclease family protein